MKNPLISVETTTTSTLLPALRHLGMAHATARTRRPAFAAANAAHAAHQAHPAFAAAACRAAAGQGSRPRSFTM